MQLPADINQLTDVGLVGEAVLDIFPLAARLVVGPALVLAEQQMLIRLMQETSGRYELLGRSGDRERNLSRGQCKQALWWRAEAKLRSMVVARLSNPVVPYARCPGKHVYDEYPVISRMVFGPDLAQDECRNLMREMIKTKLVMDDIRASMESLTRDAAIMAEKSSHLWAVAALLHRKDTPPLGTMPSFCWPIDS